MTIRFIRPTGATASLVLAASLLFACTSFDSIERGVCGNGLLEAGEDCDTPDTRCSACAVVCDDASTCPTAAYTCGVDRRCHAPGGALGEMSVAGTFEVDDVQISDVDHDGIGDAVGLSRTSLSVRHGDTTAPLTAVDSILTPVQTAPATFGDLDQDGASDVTIATQDGFVAYASKYGVLSPLTIEAAISSSDGTINLRGLVSLGPHLVTGFAESNAKITFLLVDLDAPMDPRRSLLQKPCDLDYDAADFDPQRMDMFPVTAPTDKVQSFILTVQGKVSGQLRTCVMALHIDTRVGDAARTPNAVSTITPPSAVLATSRIVLADLDFDADACPSLVILEGVKLFQWNGSDNGGVCAFAAKTEATPNAVRFPPDSTLLGHARLTPFINISLFVAAPDAIVTTRGVYLYFQLNGALAEVYTSQRKLSHVASADLDRDGATDVVLSAEGQDDVDILFRSVDPPGYTLYRVDTAGEPTTLTLGDFDADGYGDICYTETVSDHARMLIAYGTQTRPQPPVEVATFSAVTAVATLEFPSAADIIDRATDLIVIQPKGTMSSASLLAGSPQRTMLSVFDPQPNQGDYVYRGILAGDFTTTTGTTQYPDLVAIGSPLATNGMPLGWRMEGSATGFDTKATDGFPVAHVSDCNLATGSPAGDTLCLAQTLFFPWSTGAHHDVVVGIDRRRLVSATIDPWSISQSGPAVTTTTVLASYAQRGLTLHAAHPVDVDGDGKAELVLSLIPAPKSADAGAILVCKMSATGTPTECTDLVPSIPDVKVCVDAAPGHFAFKDPTSEVGTASELVVLCRDIVNTKTISKLHAVTFDGVYHATVLASVTAELREVHVGDVTGDGVDDVSAIEGDSGSRELVVFPQCSSRTVATGCGSIKGGK